MAVFHFVKLRHNVTVFTRDDPFDMGDVINPYFWKGFRWLVLRWAAACMLPRRHCYVWLRLNGGGVWLSVAGDSEAACQQMVLLVHGSDS